MIDLTQKSIEEAIRQIKVECKDKQQVLSLKPTKITFRPYDFYLLGRKDMQNEIIYKLGSYEANKCAQIATSIPVDIRDIE